MDHQKNIKHSIIIPTLGRLDALETLLRSVLEARLSYIYEILIIDQNPKGFLDNMLQSYINLLPIKHLIVSFKGLSRAKNYGFLHSNGQYLSFLDDDCKVFGNTFSNGFALIEKHKCDILFGKCIDEKGEDSVLKFRTEPYFLDKKNMLGGFIESTMLCEREVLQQYLFDENMGIGSFFGAEEGFDWLYRILTTSSKVLVLYSPAIQFYHPQVILTKGDESSLNRVFTYRCGTAYLCMKHGFNIKLSKRIFLSGLASFVYSFFDEKKASYYRVEKHALCVGKEFAKVKLHK